MPKQPTTKNASSSSSRCRSVSSQLRQCVLDAIAAIPDYDWSLPRVVTPDWAAVQDPDDSRIVGNLECRGDAFLAAVLGRLHDELYPDLALPDHQAVLDVVMENAVLLALLHRLKLAKAPTDWRRYQQRDKPKANAFEVLLQALADADEEMAEQWIRTMFTPLIPAAMNCRIEVLHQEAPPPTISLAVIPSEPAPSKRAESNRSQGFSSAAVPAVAPQTMPRKRDQLKRAPATPAPALVAPPASAVIAAANPDSFHPAPAKNNRSPIASARSSCLPLRERVNVDVGRSAWVCFNPTSAVFSREIDCGGKVDEMGKRGRGKENETKGYAPYKNPYPNSRRGGEEEREQRKRRREEESNRIRHRGMSLRGGCGPAEREGGGRGPGLDADASLGGGTSTA